MKTKLLIVRHGETDSNKEGRMDGQHETKLTQNGIEQAEKLAELLSKYTIDVVFSSPLKRAQDTAKKILIHHPHLNIQTISEFKEIDCGICTLMKRDDVIAKYPKLVQGWHDLTDPQFPEGESLRDVEKRAMPVLKKILDEYKGKTILVSGHGSLNICFLGHFLKIPHGLRFKIEQKNCCLNEITFNNDDFIISKINYF